MKSRSVPAAALAGAMLLAAAAPSGATGSDIVRDLLRTQSSAERSLCPAVRRAVGQGIAADDLVHTAIGLGYSSCEVVRCAIEAGADLGTVLEAAAGAGTPPEVSARCAVESGSAPAAVAAILNDLSRDPSYCYFDPFLRDAVPVVPPFGDADRQYRKPEFSPFVP